MNSFDIGIITFLNQFAHHSQVFDSLVVLVVQNDLFKGGVFMALLWWVWVEPKNNLNKNDGREYVLPTLFASIFAVFLARALALSLSFQTRPLQTPEIHFQIPYMVDISNLEGWSSFPSDHAALFITLAIGLILASRRIGMISLFYAIFIILLPRLYIGLHWPTDILAGALIGLAIGLLSNISKVRDFINDLCWRWLDKHPSSFYACFFLLTYQTAVLFDDARNILSIFGKLILSSSF